MYFNSSHRNDKNIMVPPWNDMSVDPSPKCPLTTSAPHSGVNVSEAGIRTETASFTGATDNGSQ